MSQHEPNADSLVIRYHEHVPRRKGPLVSFTVRLTPALADTVKALAEQEDRSLTDQISHLLTEALAARGATPPAAPHKSGKTS